MLVIEEKGREKGGREGEERNFEGKKVAEVFDYLDDQTPVLKRMHGRRLKVLKSMGFELDGVAGKQRPLAKLEDSETYALSDLPDQHLKGFHRLLDK